MTKIDIFSGFLGAGKTTLIKKLLKEAMDASKVVLIPPHRPTIPLEIISAMTLVKLVLMAAF